MVFQEYLIHSLHKNEKKIAIQHGNENISYRTLNERANNLTYFLLKQRLEKETIIGIQLNNRVDIIYSIIGIMNAKCVFVLLDDKLPKARIDNIINEINLKYIITSRVILESSKVQDETHHFIIEDILAFEQPDKLKYPKFNEQDSVYIYMTSGSTGTPRGIIGKSASLLQFVQWEIETFNIDKYSRFSQFISPYFDAYLRDIFVPLMAGGTICVPPDNPEFFVSERIIPWIDKLRVSVIHCVPSLFRTINSDILNEGRLLNLKYILLSGEKIIPSELDNWYSKIGDRVQLCNFYGTTETTMIRSYYKIYPVDTKKAKIPIGKPINDTELLIAGNNFTPCDSLIPGDLYIISNYITKGYLNNPELTNERFLKFYSEKFGDTIAFKTGDKARVLPDGQIELIGREDRQVKINGVRVEIDEIESILMQSKILDDAVVIKESEEGKDSLIGFYVRKKDESNLDEFNDKLDDFLREHLPSYMIPAVKYEVNEIPLLSNGKTDFQKLLNYLNTEREIIQPKNEREKEILEIWKKILGVNRISTKVSFNAIGGNSLSMMRLIGSFNTHYQVRISLSELFNNLTISEQADLIENSVAGNLDIIPQAKSADYFSLSSAQRRIYFLYEYNRTSLAYNLPNILMLNGKLDKERMYKSFSQLIHRHEALRTSFVEVNEEPVQQISNQVQFKTEFYRAEREDIQSIVENFVRPFELNQGPLFRVGLIEVNRNEHILMIDMHHIITDGISQSILIKDFMAIYNNEQLPKLPLQFKDFVHWQLDEGQRILSRQQDFWLNEFSKETPIIALPTDFNRTVIRNHEGDSFVFEIDSDIIDQLNSLAIEQEVSMFMVLFAAYNVLLSKLCNQEDIVVGVPVSGRPHKDLENVIGMFVNTLPIRNFPRKELTFQEFLSEIKSKTLACFENQAYQYEDLITGLNLNRDTSRNPLFDVMFTYHNFERPELKIPNLSIKPYDFKNYSVKVDMTLKVFESVNRIHLKFEYATNLFKRRTIERFSSYFNKILEVITTDVNRKLSDLEVLSDVERKQLLIEFNQTSNVHTSPSGIIDLFEAQVKKRPNASAVVFGDNRITFKELHERINQLVPKINSANDNDIIAIYALPSVEMIVGIFAVLKAGFGFLPLDPNHFSIAQNTILNDSGARVLLTQYSQKEDHSFSETKIIIDKQQENYSDRGKIPSANNPELAYVIYTSGSTGVPKGVKISHRNLLNYVNWFCRFSNLNSNDKLILTSSFAFDAIYTQLFSALVTGSELHVVPQNVYLSPDKLTRYIESQKITFLKLTPTLLNLIINDKSFIKSVWSKVRLIMLGGEAIDVSDLNRAMKVLEHVQFINHYGPTETTIGSVARYINQSEMVDFTKNPTIGKPIDNTKCYILGNNNSLAPIGVAGELCIGGTGVGLGYLGQENLSSQKFVKNPFAPEEKMYRTGDLARWHEDGNIEFLGRIDNQVKISGYRIELGHIETWLQTHDQIQETFVIVREKDFERFIIAYYISKNEIKFNELRSYLRERLPEYMIPAYFVHIEKIPLTRNGKIDRRALPDPKISTEDDYLAPSNEIEEKLVKIWSQVLKVDRNMIGINSNFFELGGNSIKLIKMNRLVNKYFNSEISIANMFRLPTIRMIIHYLVEEDSKDSELLENKVDIDLNEAENNLNLISKLNKD